MSTRIAVGVDLGATNMVAACVNNRGETEILPNAAGQATTPSVVYFGDERTIVGEEALLRGRTHPDRLAGHFKLELGRPWYHSPIGGVFLPPDVLQGCLLRQLRADLDKRFAGEKFLTIAVPAMFNELQRRATLESAQLAGFTACDIIDEPIAATLAYVEKTPPTFLGDERQSRRLLILNLGGRACEASVLSVHARGVSALATEADAKLGGHDWDLCLARYLLQQLPNAEAVKAIVDPEFRFRLLESAGKAKLALATCESTHVPLRIAHKTHDLEITRETMRELCKEIMERVDTAMQRVMEAARLTWDQLDKTILVGGAAQLPAIGNLLEKYTGRLPESWISPIEVVARGAARHARQELYVSDSPPMGIKSLCTHSVRIAGVSPHSGKRICTVLVHRGTPLPVSVTHEFAVPESGQQAIQLAFVQGDSDDAEQCTLIGRAVLEEMPLDIVAGWPIDLTLKMGINGRITIDATVRYTQRTAHLVIQRPDCVSSTHFNTWQPIVESRGGLSAYVGAARQEQAHTKLPVVIASSHPTDVSPHPETPSQENRVLSLLRRLMPFHRELASHEEGNSTASNDTVQRAPPVLEVLEMPEGI